MEKGLKPGDKVRLIHSEINTMTIEFIDEYDYASCVYFDANGLFTRQKIGIFALKKLDN